MYVVRMLTFTFVPEFDPILVLVLSFGQCFYIVDVEAANQFKKFSTKFIISFKS